MSVDLKAHSHRYAPEYGKFNFTDHLPMAVTALRRLGASEDREEEFAAQYRKKLRKFVGKKRQIDEVELSTLIGIHSAYAEVLTFFEQTLEEKGQADVLAQYMPELADTVSTAAFHGVIRTAYGLLAKEPNEIAAGLAYWWAHARKIQFISPLAAQNDNPEEQLSLIAEAFKKHGGAVDLDQPTISAQMKAVLSNRKLADVLGRAAAANVKIDKVAELSLRLFLTKPDFTSLHCVTGAHAVRIIGENIVMDAGNLNQGLWNGFCAAYASVGAPVLDPFQKPAPKMPGWDIIKSAAIASDDDHDIKFAYTCFEEARAYGRDTEYRLAAARRLGLDER